MSSEIASLSWKDRCWSSKHKTCGFVPLMLSGMEGGVGNRDKYVTADLWHHFRILGITFRAHLLSTYFNPRDAYLQRGGSTVGTPDVLESGSGTMFDMHLSPFCSTQAIIVDVAAFECGVMIDRACEELG